ncbi:MAG TPA: hypothetical protein VF594_07915, partial [Rubricoccaceae bacterium]
VRAGAGDAPTRVSVYTSGVETSADVVDALPDEAVAFVQAVAAGHSAPYPLHDAVATLRLADRVAAALR